jgi:hypothetical protein
MYGIGSFLKAVPICSRPDLKERDHLENLDADERIILKWIFKKWDGEAWRRLIWLTIGRDGAQQQTEESLDYHHGTVNGALCTVCEIKTLSVNKEVTY